ncbi:putative B3 domain-containing protein Os03g0621600 [Setaria viridis]|uniref:putative B3 domain-containing protein Os03g0621600 n=1 Tax=Setaria viridis TaxID=4556 RepID=UPI003B3A63A8
MDKRRFFVVMLDEDFKSGLIIPKKFVKNVGGQISERIKLKVRDGETYDIEVAKEHNELLLQSGWATIPKRFANNIGGQIPEEVQLEVPNGKNYNVKVAREQDALVMGSGWANFASVYDLKQEDFLVFTYCGKSHFKVCIFDPRYAPSSRSPMHGVTKLAYIIPRFTILSDKQKCKIEDKVRAIRSPYDLFVLIVKTSNVIGKSSSMGFCSEYAKKYLQGGYDSIILLHPNKTDIWEAEIEINNNRRRIGRGWWQFVSDNELKVGDICLFQLMETKKLTMTVHIIRKQESKCSDFIIGIASAEEMQYSEDTLNPMDSGGLQTSTESCAVLAKECNLTSMRKAKLDMFQKNIRPGVPLYVTNMDKTNLPDEYMHSELSDNLV